MFLSLWSLTSISLSLYDCHIVVHALFWSSWRNILQDVRLCPRGGGEELAYERGRDARRKFCIKPLKEADLGVAQASFDL